VEGALDRGAPIAPAKTFFAQQNIVIPAQAGIQRLPVVKVGMSAGALSASA
jgi:hypothetical protein